MKLLNYVGFYRILTRFFSAKYFFLRITFQRENCRQFKSLVYWAGERSQARQRKRWVLG